MAKKLGTGAGSKLSGAVAVQAPVDATAPVAVPAAEAARPAKKTERLGLVSRKPAERKPRSYRLRAADLERLSKIVEAVNELSTGRRITETDVLRGLLVMGEKAKSKQLVEAIRDAIM